MARGVVSSRGAAFIQFSEGEGYGETAHLAVVSLVRQVGPYVAFQVCTYFVCTCAHTVCIMHLYMLYFFCPAPCALQNIACGLRTRIRESWWDRGDVGSTRLSSGPQRPAPRGPRFCRVALRRIQSTPSICSPPLLQDYCYRIRALWSREDFNPMLLRDCLVDDQTKLSQNFGITKN